MIQASQSACAVVKILVKDYAIAHLQASEEVLWKRLKQARAMCTQWKTLKQASTMCTQWKRVKASSVQCAQCPTGSVHSVKKIQASSVHAQCPTASAHSVKKIHVKALWPSEGKWHTRTGNISWHFYESLTCLRGKQKINWLQVCCYSLRLPKICIMMNAWIACIATNNVMA